MKYLAPTFGGINLEDISAPRCFEIETRLKNELNEEYIIPGAFDRRVAITVAEQVAQVAEQLGSPASRQPRVLIRSRFFTPANNCQSSTPGSRITAGRACFFPLFRQRASKRTGCPKWNCQFTFLIGKNVI